MDKLVIIFLYISLNCMRFGSHFEYPQHMFGWGNMKTTYFQIHAHSLDAQSFSHETERALELFRDSDFFTCASCIFCAYFCLWDAKFLFQRVLGCNSIADLLLKIVFWTHKF